MNWSRTRFFYGAYPLSSFNVNLISVFGQSFLPDTKQNPKPRLSRQDAKHAKKPSSNKREQRRRSFLIYLCYLRYSR